MQIDAPDSGSGSLATDKSVSDGKTEPRSMSVIAVRHKWMDTLDQRAKALHRDRSELLPLAEAGEVEAQYELAQISDNADERWYWTCVAAHGGHIRSQILMGARHLTGSLSDGDTEPVEAYVWYSLASRNGDSQAESSLPELAKAMTPEQVHEARTRLKIWIPEPRRCDLHSANATR